jgi:hypothetical protein
MTLRRDHVIQSFAMALAPLLHSRNTLPKHIILTAGKDLVASIKIDILPCGQDGMRRTATLSPPG